MTDFLKTIEADGEKVVAEVKAGLTYLEDEGHKVVAWVEKEVPSSAGAIASFMVSADAAAGSLATHAASGLGAYITQGGADVETFIANLLNATHIDPTGQLKAVDVSGVSLIESIAHNLVTVGLAKVLAGIAPAIAAVV